MKQDDWRLEEIDAEEKSLTIFVSFPTSPFTDCRPNGDGLVAYHIVHELIARGHRVHVATPRAELRSVNEARLTIYEMSADHDVAPIQPLTYMLWTRKLLRTLQKSETIDIVHELNPVFTGLSLAFIGSGVPVVLGPHSSRWPSGAQLSTWTAIKKSLGMCIKNCIVFWQHREASAVVLSTPAALNNVINPEGISTKLFIVPPGIDTDQFSPAGDERPTEAHQAILFLANMLDRKGIFVLLEAFRRVSAVMPGVRLRIAGDGPELAKVRAIVERAEYVHQVECCGRIDRTEICDQLQNCTVYCLPSFGEPFGMTALEAMSCGKPLVVTETGGLGYMVQSGGGLRVPEGDSDGLAVALLALLQDQDMQDRMGDFNRNLVETKYTWPIVGRRFEAVYYHVLGIMPGDSGDRVDSGVIAEYRQRQKLFKHK